MPERRPDATLREQRLHWTAETIQVMNEIADAAIAVRNELGTSLTRAEAIAEWERRSREAIGRLRQGSA